MRLFKPGERVRLTEAPFAGSEDICQMVDGECRVMVLIELLSMHLSVRVAPGNLGKVVRSSVETFLKVMTVLQNAVIR